MLKVRHENLKEKVSSLTTTLENLSDDLQIAKEGIILVNQAVKDTHLSIENNIVSTVNHALSVVFDDPYKVSLQISDRGSDCRTPTISIVLHKDGVEMDKNLLQCVSGGQLVIISIILRIAFILLNKSHRRLLLLDESLGALSRISDGSVDSNLVKAVNMLQKLSEHFDIQMILITHTQVGENGIGI